MFRELVFHCQAVVDLRLKHMRPNIFGFHARLAFPTHLVRQLRATHDKLVDQPLTEYPQSIAKHMDAIDPISSYVRIKVKDGLAIGSCCCYVHAISKEEQIIADYNTGDVVIVAEEFDLVLEFLCSDVVDHDAFALGDKEQLFFAVLDGCYTLDRVRLREGVFLHVEAVHLFEFGLAREGICNYYQIATNIIFIIQKQRPMQSSLQSSANNPNFLQVLREFYCGLTCRKSMQAIGSEIRGYVMERQFIDYQQVAKRILDYFLRLQSRLLVKNQQNWDRIFQISTAQGEALLRLCNFPNKHLLSTAFGRLKSSQHQPHSQTQVLSLFSHACISHTHTLVTEYDNIEVQQDVRMKTYYFFKWCQYLQQARMLKQYKMREVENQKISAKFNKYGMKFGYFTAWKQLSRKNRIERDRIRLIQQKRNSRILRQCMEIVKETAQIIGFQQQLAHKIRNKIMELRRIDVYKKLKANIQHIRSNAKKVKFTNETAIIFMNSLSSKLKPLMNKSYRTHRNLLQQEVHKINTLKVFNLFKSLNLESKRRVQSIRESRKRKFVTNWRADYQKIQNYKYQKKKLIDYLTQQVKRSAFNIFNFNKSPQTTGQTKITFKYYMSSQREISQKIKNLQKSLVISSKSRFFHDVHSFSNLASQHRQLAIKYKQTWFRRLQTRRASRHALLLQRNEFYTYLSYRYETALLRHTFASMKKIPHVAAYTTQKLSSLVQLHTSALYREFWYRVTHRIEEKQCVGRLVEGVNSVVRKIVWEKLMGRSKVINQRVRSMVGNRAKKSMEVLFNMLQSNKKYNDVLAKGILKVNLRRSCKIILGAMRNLVRISERQTSVLAKIEINRKQEFISLFRQQNQQSQLLQTKFNKLSKKLFIRYLRKATKTGIRIEQQLQQKSDKLQARRQQISATKVFKQLSALKSDISFYQDRTNRIKDRRTRNALLKVKQFIRATKEKKQLQQKQDSIIKIKKVKGFKSLAHEYKSHLLRQKLNGSRKHLSLLELKNLTETRSQILEKSGQLKVCNNFKWISQFYRYLQLQKLELEQKTTKINIKIEQNLINSSRLFLHLLRVNKQNIRSEQKLLQSKKHVYFTQFIATHLSSKFSKIKFNCALKSYAKNLMKKGFKSLKNASDRSKHKQNIIRMDKTSSILMQKSIEKSFKSNTLSEQIQRFNLRKSRQMR